MKPKRDRLRGAKDDPPVILPPEQMFERFRQHMDESKRLRLWHIDGRADEAAKLLEYYARPLRIDWNGGDFRDRPKETATQRDFADATFYLHACREAYKGGDLENAGVHLGLLSAVVERLRFRVIECLPRLGKRERRQHLFLMLDEAAKECRRLTGCEHTNAFHLWSFARLPKPKLANGTVNNLVSEWKKRSQEPIP